MLIDFLLLLPNFERERFISSDIVYTKIEYTKIPNFNYNWRGASQFSLDIEVTCKHNTNTLHSALHDGARFHHALIRQVQMV